jgi:nicotinamidase-related amidase
MMLGLWRGKMPLWEDVIPEEDLRVYSKSGWGTKREWGEAPALLIVDMTKGFVEDRFPLGYSATGRPAAAAIKRLLDKARGVNVPVFYTKGKPSQTPAEKGMWKSKDTPIKSDPEIHDIVPELAPQSGESVITKRRPSAFFGTELISLLNYNRIDTVIVTGMVTSGCIRATVIDAFSYNYTVIVPEACVADRGQLPHKVNLFDMHMKYADVVPLEEVLGYLCGLHP